MSELRGSEAAATELRELAGVPIVPPVGISASKTEHRLNSRGVCLTCNPGEGP